MKKFSTLLMALLMAVAMFGKPKAQKEEAIHYISPGIGLGYSALMHNVDTASWKGGVGGYLQLAYELQYKKFLFRTGVELSMLSSFNKVSDLTLAAAPSPSSDHKRFQVNQFGLTNWKENQLIGQLNIPVMFGGQFGSFYFLVGPKIGIGLFQTAHSKADINLYREYYANNDGKLGALESTDNNAREGDPTNLSQHPKFKQKLPNIQASVELGLVLDKWLSEKSLQREVVKGKKRYMVRNSYRLGFFADYGILNDVKTKSEGYAANIAAASNVAPTLNSIYSFNGGKVNTLLVGVKFDIRFQLNRPKVKKQTGMGQSVAPQQLIVNVTDLETGEKLKLAYMDIENKDNARLEVRNARIPQGYLKRNMHNGNYKLSFRADGYLPAEGEVSYSQPGEKHEINVPMKKIDKPLRVNVINAETGKPMSVEAQVVDCENQKPLADLRTDSVNGAAETKLKKGEYCIKVMEFGYEDMMISGVHHDDSLTIKMLPVKKGQKIVIENVYFATNKTEILPESEPSLQLLYTFLSANPDVRIRILGHTDSVGSDAANMKLSDGRAKSVRQSMIDRGIAADRMEAEGRGEREPVDTNDTPEGRQNNRRVEFEIL